MPAPTITELNEAKQDIDDLESFVNDVTPANITSRLGNVFPNIASLSQSVIAGAATGVGYDPALYWPTSLNVQAVIDEIVSNTAVFKTTYAAIIAIDPDDYIDGQTVILSGAGIAGPGSIRKVAAHGFTSVRGVIVRIDDDTYWERYPEPFVDIRHFGGRDDSTTDNHTPITEAATYLLSRSNPRGKIMFPTDLGGVYEVSAGIDFHDILFTEQGLTVTAAGHVLPNGTLARDVKVALGGDGVIQTTSGFSGAYLFKFGEYQTVSLGQAMKVEIDSTLKIVGPGSFGGHVATTYVTGASGYTSTSDAFKGTDNTVTTCILVDNTSPGSYCLANIQGFNKGVVCTYGFGMSIGGSIQYCNVDIEAADGYTNLNLLASLETEVAGVGVFLNGCDSTTAIGSISEANVCNLLINASRWFSALNMWFEGGVDDVVMCGDALNPSGTFNRHIEFKGSIGPSNIDCRTGVVDLNVERCAVGSEYRFNISSGSPFRDIVFNRCSKDSLAVAFDMDTIVIPGGSIAEWEAIQVVGDTINNGLENLPARAPVSMISYTQTAFPTDQKCFDIVVPNENASAIINIFGYKKSSESSDMRMQSFTYTGVLQRFAGSGTTIEFSTGESDTSSYDTTGTNAATQAATPSTTITGAATAEQTIAVEFATGTAVSTNADTIWNASMVVADGDLSIQK